MESGRRRLRGAPRPSERQFDESWRIIRAILTGDEGGLTHKEIVGRWPADSDKPAKVPLYAWLATGLDRGLVVREGRGTSNDPQRYKLSGDGEGADPMLLAQGSTRE